MPIQGFTRLRYHQVGKQSAIATAVAATRVLPYRGAIKVQPNRTYPDVDTGSLDPNLAPFSGAKNITANWTGKLAFNDLPYLLALAGKGGITPTGSYTWTFTYASLSADSFEYITDEWGDDTNATDGIQAYGGVINDYTLGFDNTLTAWDVNANLVYANANLATAKTGALSVDSSPTWVYGANTQFNLDTVYTAMGLTVWPDTVHAGSWSWNNNLDQKRFANGSNPAFALSGYGRGAREITFTVEVAKTAASIAEANTLTTDPVPTRFIQTKVISPTSGYTWTRTAAVNLISREDGEIGGNTTIKLTYRVIYNANLTYAIKDVVVNTLASL